MGVLQGADVISREANAQHKYAIKTNDEQFPVVVHESGGRATWRRQLVELLLSVSDDLTSPQLPAAAAVKNAGCLLSTPVSFGTCKSVRPYSNCRNRYRFQSENRFRFACTNVAVWFWRGCLGLESISTFPFSLNVSATMFTLYSHATNNVLYAKLQISQYLQ